MSRRLLPRLTAAALTLALALPAPVLALTPEQTDMLLDAYYVDPVPETVHQQATIAGKLEALGDPYTQYFTPEEYAYFLSSLSDPNVVGIGVVCSHSDQGPLVNQVFPESPAGRAGLKTGDVLVRADGHPLGGLALEDAITFLRGELGTSVQVTYLRNGQETTVTLERENIIVPTTNTVLLDGHIGYIDCDRFGLEAGEHFREGITSLRDQVTTWVVDLRDNSGGYAQAAADTAACFTGPGQTAIFRDGQDHYSAVASPDDSLTLHPVIVLVNENSASASELFANSIRDRGAGIVIGQRTFGKGVVQTVLDQDVLPEYFPDGDGMKITSHRFFSPDGNTNDQIGVIPDLLVDPALALDVARLLGGSAPTGDTTGHLRLDLVWRWHLDQEAVLSEELRPAFEALLSALPDGRPVLRGTGGPDNWDTYEREELAEIWQLDLTPLRFPDVDQSPYAEAIGQLRTYGLVNGDEQGLFHPEEVLNRAQLAQLLSNLLGADDPGADCPFIDVPPDAWYRTAASNMAKLGLINGVGGGRFDPQGTVTHQQFITILGRLAAWMNLQFYNTMAKMPEDAAHMPELSDYAHWSRPWAWLLSYSQHNLLGQPLTMLWTTAQDIDPLGNTSREEAAYALCTTLSSSGALPG